MNLGLLHLTRLCGRSRFGEAKARFRLCSRKSKPPSPPHGGGEGSCGGRFMESLHLQGRTRIGAMNRGLLHLTRFRLCSRKSKRPSPPHGGGEGSCGGRIHGDAETSGVALSYERRGTMSSR